MARTYLTKQTDTGTNHGRLARASKARDRKSSARNPIGNGQKSSIRVNNTATPKNANANKFGMYSSDRAKPQDKASDYTWRDEYVRVTSKKKKRR